MRNGVTNKKRRNDNDYENFTSGSCLYHNKPHPKTTLPEETRQPTFLGMAVKSKGDNAQITVATSEGMYEMETDKEMFIKKVKAGLKEEVE